jgi:hypothetical protein
MSGMVKTDADRLLQLLRERQQIPMDEAAKALDLPAKAVEGLATFLEEESLMHITYKFTRAYLNDGPSQAVEKAKKDATGADAAAKRAEERNRGKEHAHHPHRPRPNIAEGLALLLFSFGGLATLFLFMAGSSWFYFGFVLSLTVALAVYRKAAWR